MRKRAPARQSVITSGSLDTVPIAPALDAAMDDARITRGPTRLSRRVLWISLLAIVLGVLAAEIAQLLMFMINLITDVTFYGRVSDVIGSSAGKHVGSFVLSPADNHLGLWVILMPAIGGLIAGVMARWGSRAIQGHGIPEAMEQILQNESNIPPRVTWLKPVSSAFAIGTGGPFGAEGPIISTGGALGSLIGQLLAVTATERKTLLAAGAAAGMAAVFGAPVSALVMAIELLLFELRPRSLIPVALACVTATGVRYATYGSGAVFTMPTVTQPGGWALASYILLGAVVGLLSIGVTKAVYGVEDAFEKLPFHWMWWPAIGGLVAGVVGWIEPRTMGVGYDNIDAIVSGSFGVQMLITICVLKFIAWVVALGSGTSGGTLAPLFIIGGSFGALFGIGLGHILPEFGIDPRIAALVGMAAIFAGSSRALLTAIVFAFETTRQPAALLPLLAGCTAAYMISALIMRNTIMTEKIVRRGVRVPLEYSVDFLQQLTVGQVYNRSVVTLNAEDTLAQIQQWMQLGGPDTRHHGYPVVSNEGTVNGVLTVRDLLNPRTPLATPLSQLVQRPPVAVSEDSSLREASDLMVNASVGRLIVMSRTQPPRLLGILTRGDLISAHARRLHESSDARRQLRFDLRHPLRPLRRIRQRRPRRSRTAS
ncbi:chloride channel protein [Paralcaligenes ureilyticus]|uniref:H+/Cl-antiporter ClcA n=1 Tax=Paralcaligenes ureilyticus TaxID=627131 RepID=A0A4R3LM08_9BURK|nr:chloride channel protein [Paralcaligenes ureilyticus]TCT01011.1 H+/Cl- antiporter ClcA [Paralcaligenes ureilyticus]